MENKNNGVLIGLVVVLVILVLGLIGYIAYDKGLIFSNEPEMNEEENNNRNNENKVFGDNGNDSEGNNNETDEVESVNNCVVGTYYGEASGTVNTNSMLTYNYKYRYTFNADGTYTADFNGVSGENGTYTLQKSILTVSHLPEVGPGEMLTSTLELSSDCSYILYPIETETFFKLYKQ